MQQRSARCEQELRVQSSSERTRNRSSTLDLFLVLTLALSAKTGFAQSLPENVRFLAPSTISVSPLHQAAPPEGSVGPPFRSAIGTFPQVQFGPARAVQQVSDRKPPEITNQVIPVQAQRAQFPRGQGILIYPFHLTPPSAGQLFQLDSEEGFRKRLQADLQRLMPSHRAEFPRSDAVPHQDPKVNVWPGYVKQVEPAYVISGRLYFEQRYFERYGQSCGVVQPVLCTGLFGVDLLTFSARKLIHPFEWYQVNSDLGSYFFKLDSRP